MASPPPPRPQTHRSGFPPHAASSSQPARSLVDSDDDGDSVDEDSEQQPFVSASSAALEPNHATDLASIAAEDPYIAASRAANLRPERTTHAGGGPPPEDDLYAENIEMGSIEPSVGHRRRRSSLMSPANGAAHSGRNQRLSPHSARGHKGNAAEKRRIAEEGGDGGDASGSGSGDDRLGDDISDEDLHDDEETGLSGRDRTRKRQKKQRNTRLDQRIAPGEKLTADERREADQNVMRKLLVNGALIGLWYFFSLCISLYNKWMFDHSKLNFPFPLFTTAIHMLVQFSLATLVLYFIPSLRPQNGHRSDLGQSRHESEPERPLMTKMFYLTRIGPCGAATGLDIGLGNMSLKFITLTFYTMCKSSSLAFVLLFAFVFHLEQPTWKLVAIIATMTAGVVMMVAGEVEFKLGGFALVIAAAFFSGFRWGLTQILLLRNPATSNPFSSIFFLAPVMFLTLIVIAIPVEGPFALLAGFGVLVDEYGAFLTPMLVLFPGCIAFLMTASEFALLQRTSVVTLSIAGIFKEAVTISAAAIVFGDRLTPVNVVGLFVTLGAIVSYNVIKITKMRRLAQEEAHGRALPGEGGSGSSSSGSDLEGESDDAEETGLLHRHSVDEDGSFVTSDGDIIPKPEPSPTEHLHGRAADGHRSERED